MLRHYDRSKEVPELKAPVNTVLNYNLAYNDQRLNQLDFIHRRLSEIRVQHRKDVNVMIDWVVTIPQSLNNQGLADEDRFFREAYNFLTARYGKENVISAYVHMDEVTPHMHFAFVPVTEDKKRGGFKLSAKEVVNRQDLRTFHKDLSDHMERVFGRDIGILNEATKEGNKSIADLKRSEARKSLLQIRDDINSLESEKQGLKGEIEGLRRDLLTAQEVKAVPHVKALLGDKQVVSTEDFNALCRTAATAEALLKEIVPARQINARTKEIISQAEEKADAILAQAKRESLQTVIDRARKVSDLENKLERVNNHLLAALSLLPEKAKQEFVSAWDRTKNLTKGYKRNTPNWEQER